MNIKKTPRKSALLWTIGCGIASLGLAEEPAADAKPAAVTEAAKDYWSPPPGIQEHPYPTHGLKARGPIRPLDRPNVVSMLTWDGSFEDFKPGTPAEELRDNNGRTFMFNLVKAAVGKDGYNSDYCLAIPGQAVACGIEGKTIPFKPYTWYRVGMMVKGSFYALKFNYCKHAPKDTLSKGDYMATLQIDNNIGTGHPFTYVCSKCRFVKYGKESTRDAEGNWNTDGDGFWITGGFRELPDKCPGCGAPRSALYREGDAQFYKDWTYIYADFRTNDYTGVMDNGTYLWYLMVIGSWHPSWIDDFMLYEITGEGGDPVPNEKSAE
jgi:hypothetical protein